MRVALVHGYFLHDSGSGVYVRELAHALVRLGHDVTLVCQDSEPQRCDFIDSAYVLDAGNSSMRSVHSAPRLYAGSCRLVRPHLGGKLLVYVQGPFPGFPREDVTAFQDASAEALESYVASNVAALRTVFAEWTPELVLAQHLVMQPFVVRTALAGAAPYVVTEHGSALNFSVRASEALVPFAIDGLAGAAVVATVSQGAHDDLTGWAAEHGLDISDVAVTLPPGIDAERFGPAGRRRDAIDAMLALVVLPEGFDVREDDDVLAFAGALRHTKGVQHAVAALPLIAQARGRRVRLLIAGDGPARTPLEELSILTAAGDSGAARSTVAASADLESPGEWGDVVADAPPVPDGPSVAFLGHVDHAQLASVFAVADLALVPSVFPEAAALVNVEAFATGALPLATYHSGMKSLNDFLVESLDDDVFESLSPGCELTHALAQAVVHVLGRFPTAGPEFRARIHELALSRYPTWERTAERYVAMAGDPRSRRGELGIGLRREPGRRRDHGAAALRPRWACGTHRPTMLTAAYIGFALAQLALAIRAFTLFARRPSLGAFTLALPIALLVWDNAVVALGATIGDGPLLIALSWPRFVGHALLTPIWILTGFEIARRVGVEWPRGRGSLVAEWGLYLAMAALGFLKAVILLRFEPVIQGDLFYYTNGGGFPGPPIPAIVMVLVVAAVGSALLRRTGWRWMLVGGAVMFVAAAIPTSTAGFLVSNAGEVALSAALVATERFLQRREVQGAGPEKPA